MLVEIRKKPQDYVEQIKMGYSKNRKSVERVLPILDAMLKTEGKLFFKSKHPSQLAYAIREGIKVSEHFAAFAHYVELGPRWKIRVKPDGVVVEPRFEIDYEEPIIELAQSFTTLTIANVNSVLQVVGACIKHRGAPELIFPDAQLDNEALAQLQKWTDNNLYSIHSIAPLTILKRVAEDNSSQTSGSQF